MTYNEIKEKLTKCETALLQLQSKSFSQQELPNIQEKKRKLITLKENLETKLKLIKEEDGVVTTDDEGKAEDLAKKGVNVKLTNEEEGGIEFTTEETKEVAKQVGKALIDALREAGDEIDTIKAHRIEPNSFEIYVKYKNDFEDDFSFYISEDILHLVDFSFDKEIGEVGVKPSGQAIVHTEIIKNNLLKHFKSLNEQDSKRSKYLTVMDMYKKASPQKKRELKPRLEKAAKALGMDLDLSGLFGTMEEETQVGEDLDVGHQDDEPEMLKRYVYDTAVYAAKLYKLLNKYDQLEGEVDFPNWWQEKVMRARQDISKAQHYLEFEEKQPVLDQLALQESKEKSVKELKSFEESGLMVKGRTPIDNNEIEEVLEELGLYGEWNSREGYWLLPEEEDMYDQLEATLQSEFDKRDISAYFEGIFESVVKEQFKPNIAPGSTYALQVDDLGNKVSLKQDNGQTVVIHKEDLNDVIKVLNNL